MSATSARIRTTTICKRAVTSAGRRLVADVTPWDPRVAPHAQASHPPFRSPARETRHDRYLRAAEIRIDGAFTWRGAALPDHRPDGLSHRGRSVCDAGDPSL